MYSAVNHISRRKTNLIYYILVYGLKEVKKSHYVLFRRKCTVNDSESIIFAILTNVISFNKFKFPRLFSFIGKVFFPEKIFFHPSPLTSIHQTNNRLILLTKSFYNLCDFFFLFLDNIVLIFH